MQPSNNSRFLISVLWKIKTFRAMRIRSLSAHGPRRFQKAFSTRPQLAGHWLVIEVTSCRQVNMLRSDKSGRTTCLTKHWENTFEKHTVHIIAFKNQDLETMQIGSLSAHGPRRFQKVIRIRAHLTGHWQVTEVTSCCQINMLRTDKLGQAILLTKHWQNTFDKHAVQIIVVTDPKTKRSHKLSMYIIDKTFDKTLDKILDKIRDKHAAQDNHRNNPLMTGIQDSVDLYRQVNTSI